MDLNDWKKKKGKQSGSLFSAVFIALACGLSVPVISYLGIMILTQTGIWWFPLLIGYFVILGIPTSFWFEGRERAEYHMHVGHEVYYKENPAALKKALRKARKLGIPDEVRRLAAYYRACPDMVMKFSEGREKKRRRNAILLNVGAGITLLLGIFLIWKAFPLPHGLFDQKIKTADYTSVFLIVGGAMAIISAVGLFLGKKIRPVRYAAAIILALCIWSAFLAFSLHKRPTYTDGLIFGACLIVFALAALVVPEIAGDVRTAEQVHRDRKELMISLFELGYIPEEDLRPQ